MASIGRIRTASLLVIVAGSLVMTANAQGAAAKTTTTIVFTDNESLSPVPIPVIAPDDPDTFTGTISSTTACKAARKVKVFKHGKGDAADTFMGKGVSAADGKWTVTKEDPGSGKFYAKVIAKPGCAAGRSKGIKVTDA
jgi:hypothetical protein